MCGQDAVHAGRTRYLPQLQDQEPKDYDAYVQRTTIYNATWRTIAGLAGMMLRKTPHVEVPPAVAPLVEDVGGNATPPGLLAKQVCDEVLGLGRVGVLVDYPTVAAEGMTRADALAQGLHPTLQLYRAEDILNWRCEKVGAAYVLTLAVLREEATQQVDEYQTRAVPQYRVLDLVNQQYRVRLFQQQGDGGTFVQQGGDLVPLLGNLPLPYIPFVVIGANG